MGTTEDNGQDKEGLRGEMRQQHTGQQADNTGTSLGQTLEQHSTHTGR